MNQNDDTISRKAAIEAITNYAKFLWEKFHETGNLAGMIEAIEGVPSAQRWIPVSERLPEPNEIVIVSVRGEVDVDWIAVDNNGYKRWYRCMKDVTSVDAWMPRPKPWKGEEDE